jgi:hypothetical protein
MSPINEIEVPNITIPNVVSNQQWLNSIPNIPSNHPPVTTNIGFPVNIHHMKQWNIHPNN